MESITRNRHSPAVPRATIERAYGADRSHGRCDADYLFMPYIDADNLGIIADQFPAAEREVHTAQLGAANRELDSVRGPGSGPLAGPVDPRWRRVFTGTELAVLGDARPFVRGYGHPEPTARQRVRRRPYCPHLPLITVIETMHRGHTETPQYGGARVQRDDGMALFGRTRR